MGVFHDLTRLISPGEPRRPSAARLRGVRAPLEEAERRLVVLRLHGRIDTAVYQHRMSDLAHERVTAARPDATTGGRHG